MNKCKMCSCEMTSESYTAPTCDGVITGLCCKCAGNLNLLKNKNYTDNTIAWANGLINSDKSSYETKIALCKMLDSINNRMEPKSPKSRTTAALLCFFLGFWAYIDFTPEKSVPDYCGCLRADYFLLENLLILS